MNRLSNLDNLCMTLFCVLCLWACQKAENSQTSIAQSKEIIVYGSNTCDHCIDFKAKLDSVGFTYEFRDVDVNQGYTNDLITKIQMAGIVGQINYPVVDIEGTILVTPSLNEVMNLVK